MLNDSELDGLPERDGLKDIDDESLLDGLWLLEGDSEILKLTLDDGL